MKGVNVIKEKVFIESVCLRFCGAFGVAFSYRIFVGEDKLNFEVCV